MSRASAAALLALALVGCTGGESICGEAFSERETFLLPFDTACAGCESEQLRAVVDGSGDRAARLTFNGDGTQPAGGEYSFGVVQGAHFTPGGRVGAYLTFPAGSFGGISVTFTTYHDGEKQEEIACGSDDGGCAAAGAPIDGAGHFGYYGGPTAKAFDQVDVAVTVAGTAEPATVLVHEVCAAQ